ncbi:hypothetical protein [Endozoicomonas sp. SCSIO W0465]|uniref:hypothetical protein n=1 Tax=Endozoicomonas sp. SCSIO W0465 TaxID=2918516 RepID=UPI00207501EA|nr:hypothetical protein [Endozoicomonas sp. SCSIO W0465]USE33793.1 hypothetical protein MJO57_16570 [Endozoicomonas sp. SCSIO W0465]
METTINNSSYESISMLPQSEDKTAPGSGTSTDHSTGGFFSSNKGKLAVGICIGVVIIGSLGLGLGFGLANSKQLEFRHVSSPLSNNTRGLPDTPGGGASITANNTILPSTLQFISSSISEPPEFKGTTSAPWLSSSTQNKDELSSTLMPTPTTNPEAPMSTAYNSTG